MIVWVGVTQHEDGRNEDLIAQLRATEMIGRRSSQLYRKWSKNRQGFGGCRKVWHQGIGCLC